VTPEEKLQLATLRQSLGEWGLGDIKRSHAGGAKMGVFLLGAQFIDQLARLAYSGKTTSNGEAAWREFIPRYLPAYRDFWDVMYSGFRGKTTHNYSAKAVRFTDGEVFRARHLEIEQGDRVLHLESFVEELTAAFEQLCRDIEADGELRARVFGRTRANPLLTIVGGGVPAASVAHPIAISGVGGATSYAAPAAPAASGAYYEPIAPFRLEPPAKPPTRVILKGKKKRKRKPQ
jgi:hypothetical protein